MKKILVGLLFFTSIPLIAEETKLNTSDNLNIDFYTRTIDIVEDYQNTFSYYIHESTNYIESLWESFDKKESNNRSFGIFRLGKRFSTKGELEPDFQLKLKYDLPHTKKNLKLFFDFDQQDFENLDNKNQITNEANEQLSGGLILEKQTRHWDINYKIGMNLKLPLNPFAKIEVTRDFNFNDNFSAFFKQENFYFKERGFGTGAHFDFVYSLENNNYFEVYYNIQYLNNIGWEYYSDYSYFYNIDNKNSIKAVFGNNRIYEDNKFERKRYWTQVQWKSLIHKNWLFLKVIPEISFENKYNYEPDYRLTLQFEMFFGNQEGLKRGLNRYRYN